MRESYIERNVKEYARRKGWVPRKWVSPGNAGVPDDLFFKSGVLVIIEFKAPGEKPTRLQEREHRILEDQGFVVDVVDDVDAGKRLLDSLDPC